MFGYPAPTTTELYNFWTATAGQAWWMAFAALVLAFLALAAAVATYFCTASENWVRTHSKTLEFHAKDIGELYNQLNRLEKRVSRRTDNDDAMDSLAAHLRAWSEENVPQGSANGDCE